MCVCLPPQSIQSERPDGWPEAELRGTRFHRSHHQHPHAARQHAWWEPPPIACPHPRHPAQHPGHRLHPRHRQNLLLITSDNAHNFPHPTAAPPANLPMNSELPLNLWSWTQGTASWDFGDKDYSDGYFEYRWLLSLPLPILWITWDELKWRHNGLPFGAGKSSKNQRQGIWKGKVTSRRLSYVLRITPSCILDPNTHLPLCTVLTFWISLHKPQEGQ